MKTFLISSESRIDITGLSTREDAALVNKLEDVKRKFRVWHGKKSISWRRRVLLNFKSGV